jgi:C-terminal processing protease CtpA/Prc
MRRRFGSLSLLLAVAQPLLAQDRRAQTADRPEAEVFRQTMQALQRMAMGAPSDSALWEAGIQGMIESLHDPYASIFNAVESEAWEEETTGNYSGIGLQITLLNSEITVTAVFRATPANDAGIQVGDVIVGVDQHDATEWGTDTAADSIRGPVGTDVNVRIKRQGFEEPIPFRITRAEVHVPAVSYGTLDGNIGYALMDRVARNAAQEMDAALRELGDVRGLIIDLRRNPGGFLDESLMLADIFLEPGSVLASTSQRVDPGNLASREGGAPLDVGEPRMSVESYRDRFPVRVPDLPVVVLVDRFTASGAEILAGALQDYDRALVIGERTFGKGLVQTVMRLPYGRRLRFTTGEWQTPLGRSLHRARDMEMRPLDEDLDTLPRVTTPAGRELLAGGGIFPDIEVADDTLTLVERELLRVAGEKEVPLGLRLAEFSFAVAKELKEMGQEPALAPERLDGFIQELADEGIPRAALEANGVRDWLGWRARMAIAQRMDQVGREADFRMERDPVLSEAARLLSTYGSQTALLRAAAERAAPRGTGGGV